MSSSGGSVVCITICAALLSGCEVIHSPAAPAPPASPVTAPAATIRLTVRVLARGSEEPVTAATIFRNQVAIGQTDADGIADAEVPLGVEFTIDVTAPGFAGSGATATVTSQERWTFYLERLSG